MDVNATVTTDINTTTGRGQQHPEAKKAELIRSNACFYCEIKGHQAKDCRKKQADHGNFSSCPNNPKGPTRVHIAPTIPDLQDSDSFVSYLKDNMDIFDKDTKLSMIEKLTPKDFTKAQN